MCFFQKLPGLQSFCLYCTIGIFAVFVFQATLFVACVAIDLRRLQQNRNGFLVCYQHKNHSVLPVTDELNFRRKMFRTLGKIINHLWGKVSKKASRLVYVTYKYKITYYVRSYIHSAQKSDKSHYFYYFGALCFYYLYYYRLESSLWPSLSWVLEYGGWLN